MKEGRIHLRIDETDKKAFQDKVGKRNVSNVIVRFIKKVNKSKKPFDTNDTHLFI